MIVVNFIVYPVIPENENDRMTKMGFNIKKKLIILLNLTVTGMLFIIINFEENPNIKNHFIDYKPT